MFILNNYATAVIFCFVTMICWGSWANTQKLTKGKFAFQLFYWDYTLGVLILSLIAAFTLGSIGDQGRGFLVDLSQANGSSYLSALIGGLVFNLANILLVAAIDIAGMAVAFPVAIGLALVIGVIVNYIASPVGNEVLLSIGVLSVLAAIILDAIAYKQLKTSAQKNVSRGLIIAIVSGILMGLFYRFVAASMSTNLAHPVGGLFTPYSAMVIFALGIVLSNFIWNTYMMYKPLTGEKVTYAMYFRGSMRLHTIGMLGGVIWAVGSLFSFLAAGIAGSAISYGLGQGATMIAALWGVFIWREFKQASNKVNVLLTAMFGFYLLGLVLIVLAKLY